MISYLLGRSSMSMLLRSLQGTSGWHWQCPGGTIAQNVIFVKFMSINFVSHFHVEDSIFFPMILFSPPHLIPFKHIEEAVDIGK